MSKDEYDEKANKDKDYFCKYCQDWDNKRLNKILQFSPAVTAKDLLPEYLLINLPVSICLGIYCERSLQSLLEKCKGDVILRQRAAVSSDGVAAGMPALPGRAV